MCLLNHYRISVFSVIKSLRSSGRSRLTGFGPTCTERGKTWWGSAGSRRLSWFWSRWLWGDTAEREGHVTNSVQTQADVDFLLDLPEFTWRRLTSHICSWNSRRSFSISSAISPPLNSVRIIPCCLACSRFSFSILALQRSEVESRAQFKKFTWANVSRIFNTAANSTPTHVRGHICLQLQFPSL